MKKLSFNSASARFRDSKVEKRIVKNGEKNLQSSRIVPSTRQISKLSNQKKAYYLVFGRNKKDGREI